MEKEESDFLNRCDSSEQGDIQEDVLEDEISDSGMYEQLLRMCSVKFYVISI